MRRRVIDQSLCDRARRLAMVHPLGTVAELLGLRGSQISIMRKRGWQAADHRMMVRPVPTDFAIQSERMTSTELCRHYRCGARVLVRWFALTPGRRPSWRGDALRKTPRRPAHHASKEG